VKHASPSGAIRILCWHVKKAAPWPRKKRFRARPGGGGNCYLRSGPQHVTYAGHGEIVLTPIQQNSRSGVMVIARDQGPGIPDIDRALQDGYSTGGGLGWVYQEPNG